MIKDTFAIVGAFTVTGVLGVAIIGLIAVGWDAIDRAYRSIRADKWPVPN